MKQKIQYLKNQNTKPIVENFLTVLFIAIGEVQKDLYFELC